MHAADRAMQRLRPSLVGSLHCESYDRTRGVSWRRQGAQIPGAGQGADPRRVLRYRSSFRFELIDGMLRELRGV